jgi:hypothetical protein
MDFSIQLVMEDGLGIDRITAMLRWALNDETSFNSHCS